jgi:hypothetical protein
MEIIQTGEKEFWIGDNKTVISDPNIIHVTVVGEQTDEIARLQRELFQKIFERTEGQVSYLIDLNRSGKNSPGARDTWKELNSHKKVYKDAVFGMNPVARVIASFVMGLSARKNQGFFKTESEALAWLAK